LHRGFYSATYVVNVGSLGVQHVYKVIPHAIYAFFGKDFTQECRLHNEVAAETEHVVHIRDAFDADLTFGDLTIPCHVADLDYIEGPSLADFVRDPASLTATSIAQIAIDLLNLLGELDRRQRYHNDLHADNIIIRQLPDASRRADAIDDSIRVVAIDLGSITDRSKSGDAGRLGDLHTVARHLLLLSDQLLERPTQTADLDYRLAARLSDIAHSLLPDPEMQRTPDFMQCVEQIRDAYYQDRAPWDVPLRLRHLDEGYNATTLHPWFVPQLLVDPDGAWLARIAAPGPQAVTGMRGCGKTMLIRALELHARISAFKRDGASTASGIIERLQDDGYLGLYVSCTHLLDGLRPDGDHALYQPYARLLIAYARQGLLALRHLRQEAPDIVPPDYHVPIARVVAERLAHCEQVADAKSDTELERHLMRVSASLQRGEGTHEMPSHPAVAFPHLAEAVHAAAPPLANCRLLFLLDDVTTRNLDADSIAEMFSALIFPDIACSFKLTTEGQTLEMVLRSPGQIELARDRRDYDVFDLGAEVNERLRGQNGQDGERFIAAILGQRVALTHDPFKEFSPDQRLGNVTLEDIARTIASSAETSADRKAVYSGISALTALCVGDIGDVITLYEMMVRRSTASPGIAAGVQTECYQQYCSKRLYHLNRRDGRLKDFALGFAQASHELLIRSASKKPVRPTPKRGVHGLRQYASVYVRLTTGDLGRQFEQLRELIDAGVFVLATGADAPRQKTRDADPVHQFNLTFRKLLGLSTFVGLADRDRFELSGDALGEWLEHPEKGKEILVRNLVGRREVARGEKAVRSPRRVGEDRSVQPVLPLDSQAGQGALAPAREEQDEAEAVESAAEDRFAELRSATARTLSLSELGSMQVERIVIGLGFEERTLASVDRVLSSVAPKSAVLVGYDLPGRRSEIEKIVRQRVQDVTVVDLTESVQALAGVASARTLVDVTGLSKTPLFHAVRAALESSGTVLIAHTGATQHYPSDADIEAIFSHGEADLYRQLESFDAIWAGEQGPYSFERLMQTKADDTSRRLLLASASPKHQRLLSLLEDRDYDIVEIMVQSSTSPRGRLAQLAADVALEGSSDGLCRQVDSDDLGGALDFIARRFFHWYISRRFAVDLGLTGSKMHAVAAAAASITFRISQCWYVRPAAFDPDRFTQGVGDTLVYELTMPRPSERDDLSGMPVEFSGPGKDGRLVAQPTNLRRIAT
jgi:serine/threonine protein kinase